MTGGGGLVGQNLSRLLAEEGFNNLLVLDRDPVGLETLKRAMPRVETLQADLSREGDWMRSLEGAELVVQLQAEITSIEPSAFQANTLQSTEHVIEAARQCDVPFLIHLSSSVVLSKADDDYVRSKAEQEKMVERSGLPSCTLRPTLLFGPHDRKHLAWLAGFMARSPVFPIPGDGRFIRQPLYVADLCRAILWCSHSRPVGRLYDVTGAAEIEYVELIRSIKRHSRASCAILPLPKGLFRFLLRAYALFVRKPPFTADQLDALTVGDVFDGVDFETEFGFQQTPLDEALRLTFGVQP